MAKSNKKSEDEFVVLDSDIRKSPFSLSENRALQYYKLMRNLTENESFREEYLRKRFQGIKDPDELKKKDLIREAAENTELRIVVSKDGLPGVVISPKKSGLPKLLGIDSKNIHRDATLIIRKIFKYFGYLQAMSGSVNDAWGKEFSAALHNSMNFLYEKKGGR